MAAAGPEPGPGAPLLNCAHYSRSCRLKAPCCGKFYTCRLCHDDVENHQLDRFKVTQVQCAKCETVQQVKRTCESCETVFGEYYCDTCHLFDVDKKQYHCPPCGICSVMVTEHQPCRKNLKEELQKCNSIELVAEIGPEDNFFHCVKCNLCLATHLRGNHKCVENVSRQNCPVCMEDIHTSRIGAHVLTCGHLLHKTCYEMLFNKGAYRCPLCMQSAVDMTKYWEELDTEIAQTAMPSDYQNMVVKIMCNDCQLHSTTPFHVLGLKCSGCGSYNTAQDGGLITLQGQQ